MAEPLAYLLTWTTYGSWLHGDRRGSVDRNHNLYKTPFKESAPALMRYQKLQLKTNPVKLDKNQQTIVAQTIELDSRYREYKLFALSCSSNHIHVVVNTGLTPPEQVLRQFKAYATRSLRKQGHFIKFKIWTTGGSTRHLLTQSSVDNAINYVNSQ